VEKQNIWMVKGTLRIHFPSSLIELFMYSHLKVCTCSKTSADIRICLSNRHSQASS